MAASRTDVSTGDGGYAAGRDQFVMPPPEVIQAMVASATAPLERQNAEQRQEIRALGERLGTSEGIVRAALATLGEHTADVQPDALPARVAELVRQRQDLHQKQERRPPDPDVVLAAIDRELVESLERGDDERAGVLLERKRALKVRAAAKRRETADALRRAEDRDLLEAAEAAAALGDLAMARLDYLVAAERFAEAAATAPDGDAHQDARLAYRDRAADALYRQGTEFGDKAALKRAIDAHRDLLTFRPRNGVPLDWAATQNNLGNALARLGEQESGAARLEEAVAAFRAALEERTRERVPLDWATTQQNLGLVLWRLGERESGTARLEEAVAVYRAALEELIRERVPLDWATTQQNLGTVLQSLGEREGGTARLEEALAAYRAALEERTRERVPLDWATTQNNLGNALLSLGEREARAARLQEAVAAYQAALDVLEAAEADYYVKVVRFNLDVARRALDGRRRGGGLA